MEGKVGSSEDKEQKQKLTLGISREVIERAKAANINISSITEKVLNAMTYDEKGGTIDDLVKAYETLFEAARPVLRRYDATIDVGSEEIWEDGGGQVGEYVTYLDADGLIGVYSENGEARRTKVSKVVSGLYSPKKILEQIILGLINAEKKNKNKVKELEFALKFIEVLSNESKQKRTEKK